MSYATAAELPLAVRVRNARYDGMVTGWLHDEPKFGKLDPGGHDAGSIVLDQRLGFRTDIMQPFTRVYILDKRTGDVVFEGDATWPGTGVSSDTGPLVSVNIEGGNKRMGDWTGARIYIDRDFEAWKKTNTANVSTNVEAGDDRGGSGSDALTLAFPMDQHVEANHRAEAIYDRIREAGQEIGWLNYAWDGGHTSGSPGWLVRSIATPPSTVVRSQILSVAGGASSGAVWGGSLPTDSTSCFLQLIWTDGSSSTGTSGNDIVWCSFLRIVVQAKLLLKDGTARLAGSYSDFINAVDVWNDLLGDQLSAVFDGPGAQLDAGTSFQIRQLAFPDGVTPQQVVDELMTFEPGCTYYIGASNPANNKYSVKWLERSPVPRYEAMVWIDEQESGIQEVDQYNRVVGRWRTPVGNLRITVATQTIPEMDAVGIVRTYWHDLSNTTGDTDNVAQANAKILADHRYPANSGRVTINRPIVDNWTGRTVMPWEIEPGAMIRIVGVNPTPDGVNAAVPNGGGTCRIVKADYGGSAGMALDLDGVPVSLLRAIMNTKKNRPPPTKRV